MALLHLTSPQTGTANTTQRIMLEVCLATGLGLGVMIWHFGWGSLVQVIWAMSVALVAEALVLKFRHKPLSFYLKDGSALVTGLLLGLSIPPIAPWWIGFIGVSFAIIVGKQLYGGLGFNPFNPAMLGYVLLLISFPVPMTAWLSAESMGTELQPSLHPNLLEASWIIFFGQLPNDFSIDAFTMATPLDALKTAARQGQDFSQIIQQETSLTLSGGVLLGKAWTSINIAFLAGGIFLLLRGVMPWHTPAGVFLGLGGCALCGYWVNPSQGNVLFHLFSGATCLGAFFIATDPVSGASSNLGRFIFGFLVGIIVYLIRIWGGYPDAFAFAVLLMNLSAPTIDYYTRPRVYGHATSQTGLMQKKQN